MTVCGSLAVLYFRFRDSSVTNSGVRASLCRTPRWNRSAIDPTQTERRIKNPYVGPGFSFFFFWGGDLKWLQMLLGMTNRLRISAAASPLMIAYAMSSTDLVEAIA